MAEDGKILCSENYSPGGRTHYIVSHQGKENVVTILAKKKEIITLRQRLMLIIRELFLPKGYPFSVSDDYTAYQIWDTAQAFCSTVLGILATHEILRGVGVGDASASAAAATVTWVLRDVTAHVGRITFAWSTGSSMDSSSKQWRLFADILNDLALTLELMLPIIGYTVWLLCLTTAMKAIVGVAGSATRAALTQHHAQKNNLADVAAKDSSQETAVNLIASLTTIILFPQKLHWLLLWWFVLTCSHVYCNYRAVKSICLTTVNRTRFLQLINLYLAHEVVASPADINSREPVFFMQSRSEIHLSGFEIKLGQSLNDITKHRNVSEQEMLKLFNLHAALNYSIFMDTSKFTIHVLLSESALSADIMCAYFHATILGIVYHSINHLPLHILNSQAEYADRPFPQLCRVVREKHDPSDRLDLQLLIFLRDVCTSEWKQFHRMLGETGWNTDKQLLDVGEWRTNWKNPSASLPPSDFLTSSSSAKCDGQMKHHRKRNSEWMIKAKNYLKIMKSDEDHKNSEDETVISSESPITATFNDNKKND